MKRNRVSTQELRERYETNKDRCRDVKPWSLVLDDEKYVVPVSDRAGAPLIKGAYQQTNNKAHRDFSERVASIPRYISIEHRDILDKYVAENGCTLRDAIERAIELLAGHTN